MATASRLEVSGISKSYGSFEALSNLSFNLAAGETLGLLGPNGAGKTTAIRVLTTIYLPSRGHFAIDGIPHTRPNEIRSRIGVLPESPGYPLQLTGEEYLVFFGRLFGRSRGDAQTAARNLLSTVGLTERAGSRIATYSRGMRQRLGIARALVNDPKVLFLDEPTLGFDPKGQREVLDIIKRITSQRDASVILSTHFMEAVEHVCSRVIILNRGRVMADGTVAEIKDRITIPRAGWFRVPPEKHDMALAILKRIPVVREIEPEGDGSGSFLVVLDEKSAESSHAMDEGLNVVISAFVEARIPLLSFSPETASLGDAFLEITKEES
jgi:ABC-2 type transport system ATP-binding protein